MNRNRDVGALLLVLTCVGCTGRTLEERLTSREMEAPAAPGSGEPNLAVAPDGRVLLSWIEPAGDDGRRLRYSSRSTGGAWSAPATIATGKDWFVKWADSPSVAALPDGTLFAHWLAKSGPATYAYDVRVSTSRDAGRSWSTPVVPHRDGTQSEHGFVSMAPWRGQEMGLVWLDGRKTAGASREGHGPGAAEMSLVHTTLDADGRLGPETVLDPRVCDCCQTDAAVAEGATVVVYRDRSADEVRDMSVVRFAGGRWSEPRTLARDGWEINGCPVNGPAISRLPSRSRRCCASFSSRAALFSTRRSRACSGSGREPTSGPWRFASTGAPWCSAGPWRPWLRPSRSFRSSGSRSCRRSTRAASRSAS